MEIQQDEGPDFEAAVDRFLAEEPVGWGDVRMELRGYKVNVMVSLESELQTLSVREADARLDHAEDAWVAFLDHAPRVREFMQGRRVYFVLVESIENASPICRRCEDLFEWAPGFLEDRPATSSAGFVDVPGLAPLTWRETAEGFGVIGLVLLAAALSAGGAWGLAKLFTPEVSLSAAIFSGFLFAHATLRKSIVERMIVLAAMMGLAWLAFPDIPFLAEASGHPRIPLAAGIGLGVGTVLGSITRALLGAAPSPASDPLDFDPSDSEAPH
jgi:hypothetical protein